MNKRTQRWIIRFALPSLHAGQKSLSSTTFDRKTGRSYTLLPTGDIIDRPLIPGEKEMMIFLSAEHWENEIDKRENKQVKRKYLQGEFIVPHPDDRANFSKDELAEMKKHEGVVEFAKRHIAVSWRDAKGTQLNTNFSSTDKAYFMLMNLDEIQNEEAESEMLYNRLMGELIEIKNDPEEFMNVAYGFGINPHGLTENEIFNLLKGVVRRNLKSFEYFLHSDADRWYKVVLNRALKTKKANADEMLITQDEHQNFSMNGIMISNGFAALTRYMKDNPDAFAGLEIILGVKKKEADGEQMMSPRKPGRPRQNL